MNKFIKTRFTGTEVVMYDGQFVARFKRGGRGSFLTFLVKNFTVEEYFSQLNSGVAPLKILETKGYLLPHIKRLLKESGYEVSLAGFNKLIEDRVDAKIAARTAAQI